MIVVLVAVLGDWKISLAVVVSAFAVCKGLVVLLLHEDGVDGS